MMNLDRIEEIFETEDYIAMEEVEVLGTAKYETSHSTMELIDLIEELGEVQAVKAMDPEQLDLYEALISEGKLDKLLGIS